MAKRGHRTSAHSFPNAYRIDHTKLKHARKPGPLILNDARKLFDPLKAQSPYPGDCRSRVIERMNTWEAAGQQFFDAAELAKGLDIDESQAAQVFLRNRDIRS